MTPDPVTVSPSATLEHAVAFSRETRLARCPWLTTGVWSASSRQAICGSPSPDLCRNGRKEANCSASFLLEALDISRHRFDSLLHLSIAFGRELLAWLLKCRPEKRHLKALMRRYILAAINNVHDLIEGKFPPFFFASCVRSGGGGFIGMACGDWPFPLPSEPWQSAQYFS